MIHPDFKMKAAFAAFIFLRRELKNASQRMQQRLSVGRR